MREGGWVGGKGSGREGGGGPGVLQHQVQDFCSGAPNCRTRADEAVNERVKQGLLRRRAQRSCPGMGCIACRMPELQGVK